MALAAAPASAWAATPEATFSVGPVARVAYLVLRAAPGAELSGAVRVTNTGNAPGVALLYPVDGTTGATTGAVYRARTDPRRGVGAWLALDRPRVALAAGESALVGYRLRIPADARPGEHLGGVVAEDPALRRGRAARHRGSSFRIDVRRLSIVAALVRVPGPAPEQLDVTGVRAGARTGFQTLLVGMANPGNLLVHGRGRLVVRDEGGKLARRAEFPVDTFVPRTRVDDPVPVGGRALAAGTYTGEVVVGYGVHGSGRTARWSGRFTVTDGQIRQVFAGRGTDPPGGGGSGSPVPWIIAALGVLVGGAALLRSRAIRSGHARSEHVR